jgi:hypothetical protein
MGAVFIVVTADQKCMHFKNLKHAPKGGKGGGGGSCAWKKEK